MANSDGSVNIEVNLDPSKADKELAKLKKKIVDTEKTISETQQKRDEAQQKEFFSAVELDRENAKLEEIKNNLNDIQLLSKDKNLGTAQRSEYADMIPGVKEELADQKTRVKLLQSEYNKVASSVERYDEKLKQAQSNLEKMETDAGELVQQINSAGSASNRMEDAAGQVDVFFKRFTRRLKGLATRVFVFTLITQALRGMRTWLGNVIKTNSEATASIARLKGALLTLAQPIVEVIVPAFVSLVNVLTKIVSVAARLVASLFGKTASQSKEAAKSLYKQSKSLNSVGKAAEYAAGSLAGFDEINTIQTENQGQGGGIDNTEVAPDFSAIDDFDTAEYKRKIDELTTYISGALLALGAILTFSGANIPLGLAIMALGAAGLAAEVKENWNAMDGKVRDAINRTLLMLGGSLLAIGAILAFSGINIPLGLGLMAVGAASLAAAVSINWNTMSEEMQNTITNILIAIGEALIVIGAILAFSGANVPLGLGLMATGAASMGAAAALDWEYVSSNIEKIVSELMTILGVSLLALGAILTFSGANMPLGIGLIAAGAVSLAASAALNWNAISTALKGPVGVVTAIASAALLALGLILCFTGVNLPLGVGLISAGALGLVSVAHLNWDTILQKLKGVWGDIKNWWKTSVSKYFTLDYWKGLGKDMIEGLLEGLNDIFSGISTWAANVWSKITGAFSSKNAKASVTNSATGTTRTAPRSVSVPSIEPRAIPRLATGGVIPPNREFMAVLGDNKRETEVVSPLSTMKQAMVEALQEAGGAGGDGTPIQVNLVVDGKTLASVIVPSINDMTRRAGKPVLLI